MTLEEKMKILKHNVEEITHATESLVNALE